MVGVARRCAGHLVAARHLLPEEHLAAVFDGGRCANLVGDSMVEPTTAKRHRVAFSAVIFSQFRQCSQPGGLTAASSAITLIRCGQAAWLLHAARCQRRPPAGLMALGAAPGVCCGGASLGR